MEPLLLSRFLPSLGILINFPTWVLAHLQLGRAYAMSGDGAKAKAAYRDFFNLWKDADPDIPILKQPKMSTPSCNSQLSPTT